MKMMKMITKIMTKVKLINMITIDTIKGTKAKNKRKKKEMNILLNMNQDQLMILVNFSLLIMNICMVFGGDL